MPGKTPGNELTRSGLLRFVLGEVVAGDQMPPVAFGTEKPSPAVTDRQLPSPLLFDPPDQTDACIKP